MPRRWDRKGLSAWGSGGEGAVIKLLLADRLEAAEQVAVGAGEVLGYVRFD